MTSDEHFDVRLNRLEHELRQREKEACLKRVKPIRGDEYYYCDEYGTLRNAKWADEDYDEYRYYQGNCFKTEDEVLSVARNSKTKANLKRLAEKLNRGFTIDWEDATKAKYFIFSRANIELFQDVSFVKQVMGNIYCLDKNFLELAINDIGYVNLIEMIRAGV